MPTPHGGQSPPPQSTSVSFRFFTRSMQLPCAHTPCLQYALMQSVSCRHIEPTPQCGQAPPPQSTSDSWPSATPLSHETFPTSGAPVSLPGALPPRASTDAASPLVDPPVPRSPAAPVPLGP
jgi:hypothetical protein